MKRLKFSAVATVIAILFCAGLATAGTLSDVKTKGFVSVGVNEGLFGC